MVNLDRFLRDTIDSLDILQPSIAFITKWERDWRSTMNVVFHAAEMFLKSDFDKQPWC